MKILKKAWIAIPIFLPCMYNLFDYILGTKNLTLRSGPAEILFWLWVFSVIAVLAAIGMYVRRWSKQKEKHLFRAGAICLDIVLSLVCVGILGLGFFASAFSYEPEHVTEKNNQTMIASVNSFTDVYVYYYAYKGPFLRGKECLGEEWYGSGDYDPFTTSMEVTPKRSTFTEYN